ncbi:MAG: nucleoside deaminase [Methylocystis sp.]|uniref:nucleoside deaminase n=1 Tax=Methylocystis sp. TaxID=1911079 RepID=UPI003DA1EFF2
MSRAARAGVRFRELMMAVDCCGCGRHWNRRETLAALACVGVGAALPPAARAEASLAPAQAVDEGFMRLALAEAARGDFPFGAVIVRDGRVVARGRNMGVRTNDPTAHGEMVAIRHFLSRHPARALKGATLYTTGEPCPMCMGAILWCGFGRLVYAASIHALSARIGQIMATSEQLARDAPFAKIEITGGVLEKEALALFR